MAVSVTLPALGESVTEGTVTRWLKAEGERVEADEPLLEVSTDKVDTEIPAPASGVLPPSRSPRTRRSRSAPSWPSSTTAPARPPPTPAAGRAEPPPRRRAPAAPAAAERPLRRAARRRPGSGRPRPRLPPAAAAEGTDVVLPALGESRHRGHRHPLAEGGRRRGRGGRAAARGLHRQGRHRDPLPGRRHPAGDPGRRGRDRRGRRQARRHRRRRRRPAPASPGRRSRGSRAGRAGPRQPAPAHAGPAARPAPLRRPPAAPLRLPRPAPAPAPHARPAPAAPAPPCPATEGAYVTPLVRKLAAEHGVDLGTVKGTGVGGRIRKQDVIAAAEAAKAAGRRPGRCRRSGRPPPGRRSRERLPAARPDREDDPDPQGHRART